MEKWLWLLQTKPGHDPNIDCHHLRLLSLKHDWLYNARLLLVYEGMVSHCQLIWLNIARSRFPLLGLIISTKPSRPSRCKRRWGWALRF